MRPQTILTTDPNIYAKAIRCKELDKGQKSVPFQQVWCTPSE